MNPNIQVLMPLKTLAKPCDRGNLNDKIAPMDLVVKTQRLNVENKESLDQFDARFVRLRRQESVGGSSGMIDRSTILSR